MPLQTDSLKTVIHVLKKTCITVSQDRETIALTVLCRPVDVLVLSFWLVHPILRDNL